MWFASFSFHSAYQVIGGAARCVLIKLLAGLSCLVLPVRGGELLSGEEVADEGIQDSVLIG